VESRPNLVYIYVVSVVSLQAVLPVLFESMGSRVQLKCDGTRLRTGGGGGKGRGNRRMEWVASTLHTTSEHGVSSITAADAHTSVASSRLN
jgi:hypothetical protein